ncbi:EF-hand domain-containing protein [Rhodocyclus tenuis]|uniref:Ca2+-binding EF-hand superfamily protein n=1 Tax=Rhodocyclus tenuis TaxID=1066 RepID=A0A840G1Y4_RHOTE|nr:EF-hand domain-containing protein [Rhodocyclus tenuis]MBB4245955.1 Ca2+-binding EF-hand superfamily protein [Rhodocyclus tenuis]
MSISIGSSLSTYSAISSLRQQRPDAATVAEDIFSKLDTSGQGYLELSDFETAFASLDSSSSSSTTTSAEDVFAQIDADRDGKVTQDELTSKLQELADTLDSQFDQSRVAGGMPPPPPQNGGDNGEDQGLSEDEMTAMASDVAASDSNLASLLNTVVGNFDAADTDGDGRVTFKESQAYAEQSAANGTSSTTSDSSTSSSTATAAATTADSGSSGEVLRRILDLVRAYGLGDEGSSSNSSAISVSV